MDTENKIAESLGMALVPEVVVDSELPVVRDENQVPAVDETNQQLEDDFELARKNVLEAIADGKTTLAEIMDFAKQAGSHFAYASLASFFEKYLKANQTLLDLHKTKESVAPTVKSGNTNILILTTAELLHKMKEEAKKLNG